MVSIISFLILMAATFYAALIYNSVIMITLFIIEVVLFAAGIIQCIFVGKNIQAEVLIPVSVADMGKSVRCKVRLFNNSVFPAANVRLRVESTNIFTGNKKHYKAFVSLKGRESRNVEITVSDDKCGVVTVTVDRIWLTDMLGLISCSRRISAGSDIIFMPEFIDMNVIVEPSLINYRGESSIYDKNRGGDDTSEVFGIRDYRDGDRLQSVHWRATARSGDMMVKEFSLPIACSLLIIADMHNRQKNVWKNADIYVTQLLSYSLFLITSGCHHCIAWYDSENDTITRQEIHSEEDVYILMSLLMRCRPFVEEKNLGKMYKDMYPYDKYLKTYIFTMDLNMREGNEVIWNGKNM